MQKSLVLEILNKFEKNKDKVFLKDYIYGKQYTGEKAIYLIYKIASKLISENCTENSRIAIFSQNMPEWSLVDIACMLTRITSVPIFATNNSRQTDYILNDANVNTIFVGEKEQYKEILKIERCPSFRIIVFDDNVELKTENSIYFKDWVKSADLEKYKSEIENRKNNISEQDLITLIYTSGTTGKAKGVELRNKQFNAMVKNHIEVYALKSKYTSLAFLPLSHVFERGWTYLVLSQGMTNVYLSDPKLVAEALEKVKPNLYCAVPRLYEKVYAKIIEEISKQPFINKKIFYWAIDIGKERLKYEEKHIPIPTSLALKNKVARNIVFNKIKQKLGGKLVYCPCGGAYIPGKLVKFFRAIEFPLLVGYGLTETSATVTSFTIENFKVGTVGKPIVNVDVKIGENNEILIKGDTVTSGYYNLDQETKELFTEDGWLRSGDAGHIDEDGYLVITDRIKQLIKTANGKYIAPQLVEGHLSQSPFVSQAIVIGEGKPFASALLTIDREFVKYWAETKEIKYENLDELVENNILIKAIEKSINKEQISLSNYEKVKRFKVLAKEFTMDKEELTPTLKLKRKVILEKYSDLINQMYE